MSITPELEIGLYDVTYVPYWNIQGTKTDRVHVKADGHYVQSTITGRFNKTQRYNGSGYIFKKVS